MHTLDDITQSATDYVAMVARFDGEYVSYANALDIMWSLMADAHPAGIRPVFLTDGE